MNRVVKFFKKILHAIEEAQMASARSKIAYYIRDIDPELRNFKGDRVELDRLLKKKGMGGI